MPHGDALGTHPVDGRAQAGCRAAMKVLLEQLRARPRLMSSVALGVAVGLALGSLPPFPLTPVQRLLLGWNATVWFYLVLVWLNMSRLDHGQLRKAAAAQADGAGIVLALAIAGTIASLGAVAIELAAARTGSSALGWPSVALALATIVGTWLLLPTEFALSYASRYFADPDGGLSFAQPPSPRATPPTPNYIEFFYFAITIAATAQTSDTGVTTRAMRRFVILHAIVSFGFNTFVLALAINMAASLF